MGSVISLSSAFSPFCPSPAYRESLGHSLSSGRPFCPFHPGLPRCPGFGATGGRHFPPLPIRERDDRALFPSSPGGSSPRTRGSPGPPPPHPGGHDAAVPRRLSSAVPILPLAPPGLSPRGLGHCDCHCPGGRKSHETSSLADLRRRSLRLDKKASPSLMRTRRT
jgi:hypothetical protein